MNIKIKRNVSLREQVADVLREVIDNDYSKNDQIPNEMELAENIGVSRGTIRQALSILEAEGIIVRKQGSGTYLNPHVLQYKVRADLPYRFMDLIERAGYGASVKLIDHWEKPAPEDIANQLLIPEGTPLLGLRRLFCARDKPAIYVIDHIPLDIISVPFQEQELTGLLFEFLENHCNMQASYTLSELVPSIADGEVAQILEVPEGSPILKCNDLHFNRDNQPVISSMVFYDDNIIRFTVLRRNKATPNRTNEKEE